MNRIPIFVAIAALGLTACTDQPEPAEPTETATVTETVTATPSAEPLPSQERVARMIARILDHPSPGDLATGNHALEKFTDMLALSLEDPQADSCVTFAPGAVASVAVYGLNTPEEEDPEITSGLAAFAFDTVDEATDFTYALHESMTECDATEYVLEPLTHHTDEAFQLQREPEEDNAASVVIVRNEHWVLASVSTPPSDLALSLTLVDQLDEMLR